MKRQILLPAFCALGLALAGPARSDTVTLKPAVHRLGEWIDGMAFDGKSIFIAETGSSSIAELDKKYGIVRRIKPGGVPLKIAMGPDAALYAILEVEGDTRLWRRPAGGAGGVIPGLEGVRCPSALAAGEGGFVWVLAGCNDEQAVLLRVDPKTGAVARVTLGPGGGGELMLRQGQVWIGLDRISVVDVSSLAVRTVDVADTPKGTSFGPFATGADRVYAVVSTEDAGAIIAVDPVTLKTTARATIDRPIGASIALTADAQSVVAAAGRITVLSAVGLEAQRVIDLPLAEVEARATMIRNGELLVTDFRLKDARERGALLVLRGWRPGAKP